MTAGNILSLPIEDIGELPDAQYVGLIDTDAVTCLTARLAIEGLLAPIWLRRNGNAAKTPWSVVAGRHRLRAAMRLGWTHIDAEQRADASSDSEQLRRLQVAENLDRRPLRPIELACHVMERWREAAAAVVPTAPYNQQSAAIRQRWSGRENIAHTSAGQVREIDAATAKACGKSDRWVRTYRLLHEAVVTGLPDYFARLNAHPLGDSFAAMDRLRTLNAGARLKAAELILQRDDWQSIDAVLVEADLAESKGARSLPHQHDARALSLWTKMTTPQRESFALQIVEKASSKLAAVMLAALQAKPKTSGEEI